MNEHPGPTRLDWRWRHFDELELLELHGIFRARQQVFSIEQQCIYLDADGLDVHAFHLAAWSPGQEVPLAYARLLGPGAKYTEPSMGRVMTTQGGRGYGLGRELVRRVIDRTAHMYPGQAIRISAQTRLEAFYCEFGFEPCGVRYLEDGIDHTEMLLPARS